MNFCLSLKKLNNLAGSEEWLVRKHLTESVAEKHIEYSGKQDEIT